MNSEFAEIEALWIGEIEPDTFSWLIQFMMTLAEGKTVWESCKIFWQLVTGQIQMIDYSHNAFLRNGMVWHGSISDDPKYDGFCPEPLDSVLKGSKVRFCGKVKTRFTHERLDGYLEARRGTPYSQRQNLASIYTWLYEIPLVRRFFKTGKQGINCSEVLAEICEGGTTEDGCVLRFGDHDRVKPTDTFKVIQPRSCDHDHISLCSNN